MADKNSKFPENVPGTFYVDEACIDCDACRAAAPDNFIEGEGHSFVYKQPENETERQLCIDALEGCPVEAIGSDGP